MNEIMVCPQLTLSTQHMTKPIRQLLLSLLLLLTSAMSHSVAPVPPQPLPANIQGWSPNWLVGTTLDLVSETRVLTLRFGESGFVAITAGQKAGPLTGPLLPWRIENGKLLIGYSAQPKDGIEFVSISGNKLVTRSEGRSEIYEVSR